MVQTSGGDEFNATPYLHRTFRSEKENRSIKLATLDGTKNVPGTRILAQEILGSSRWRKKDATRVLQDQQKHIIERNKPRVDRGKNHQAEEKRTTGIVPHRLERGSRIGSNMGTQWKLRPSVFQRFGEVRTGTQPDGPIRVERSFRRTG